MEECEAIKHRRLHHGAEYIAASEAAKEVVWLKNFLMDLEVVPFERPAITLYCDNCGAVANSKELRSHKRGKHMRENTITFMR